MKFLLAMLLATVLAVSAFGWGTLLRRGREAAGNVTLTIATGLGVYLAAGGLLSTLHVAYGLAIDALVAAGVLLAAWWARREAMADDVGKLQLPRLSASALGPTLIVLVVALFAAATAMFPAVFNVHDDYQKYFTHPVKMLETGSYLGSPVSAIGKETLGAQAVGQAFFVRHLGPAAMNVFDGFFCLVLAAAMALEHGWRARAKAAAAILALALPAISPLYVNVASLYSTTLFLMVASLLAIQIAGTHKPRWRDLAALGLCYAILVSLKPLDGLFAAVHFTAFFGLLAWLHGRPGEVARAAAQTVGWGAAFLAPWAAVPATMWIAYSAPAIELTGTPPFQVATNLWRLFDVAPMFYPERPLIYTAVVAITVVAAIFTLPGARATVGGRARAAATWAGVCALILGWLFLVVVIPPVLLPLETAYRYAVPLVIAFSVTTILFAAEGDRAGADIAGARAIILTAASLVLLLFLPSTYGRLRQVVECGSDTSIPDYACNTNILAYNAQVLGGGTQAEVRGWQGQVPPGATVLAWINTTFQLDFRRNKIVEADLSGLDNPWADVPATDFVIWDRLAYTSKLDKAKRAQGGGGRIYDRRALIRSTALSNYLSRLAAMPGAKVVHDDGRVLILGFPKG